MCVQLIAMSKDAYKGKVMHECMANSGACTDVNAITLESAIMHLHLSGSFQLDARHNAACPKERAAEALCGSADARSTLVNHAR